MKTFEHFTEYHKDLLAIAAMRGQSVYENELNKLSNLPVFRNKDLKTNVTITNLFRYFWDDFYAIHKDNLRESIVKNVEALIGCRDFANGYTFFECPKCDNYHIKGFSCNSRFCSSCGKKYRDMRALNIQSKLLNVSHRHFVFSVPFDLRPFFWKCRNLFNTLFKSVNEALLITLNRSKKDKKNDTRLGFIAFLHTSGRSLNPHPHLHVLLAEKKINRNGKGKKHFFFPFKRLKITFMNRFLSNANEVIKKHGNKSLYKEFNIVRTKVLKQYKDGFYVFGPKVKENNNVILSAKATADYISRYASHPPIADSNLLVLNYQDKTITWTYTPHEDKDNPVVITESVFNFIAKLIRHIPDNKFHLLRYYGFYANRAIKRRDNHLKLIWHKRIYDAKNNLKWRIMIKKYFNFDPLRCHCGNIMLFNYNLSYFGKHDRRFFSDG